MNSLNTKSKILRRSVSILLLMFLNVSFPLCFLVFFHSNLRNHWNCFWGSFCFYCVVLPFYETIITLTNFINYSFTVCLIGVSPCLQLEGFLKTLLRCFPIKIMWWNFYIKMWSFQVALAFVLLWKARSKNLSWNLEINFW